jgi:TP901 family phage tail tape measure protein
MPTVSAILNAQRYTSGAQQVVASNAAIATSVATTNSVFETQHSVLGRLNGAFVQNHRGLQSLLRGFTALYVVREVSKILIDFNDAMGALAGVAGISRTSKAFEEFNDVARQLGATTLFTATEAAEGLLYLSRAGFSATEAIEALPATLDLAIGGLIGLGEAADIASNILRQFDLDAIQTEKVVDTLVGTANSSNTSVQQLANALKFVGPIAGALGAELEETAASIGALGNAGIQSAFAGTALRGLYSSLLGPTKEASDVFERMGLSMEQTDVAAIGLIEVMENLNAAGLNAADAITIFNRRQASAALIMAGSIPWIDQMVDKYEEMEGVSRKNSALLEDTIGGSWKFFLATMQEAVLAVGDDGLTGTLRGLLDVLTATAREFLGFAEATDRAYAAGQILANAIRGATIGYAAFLALGIAVKVRTITTSVWAMAAATHAMNAAIAANPLGLFAAAIGVTAFAIYQFTDKAKRAYVSLDLLTESTGRFATENERLDKYLNVYDKLIDRGKTAEAVEQLDKVSSAISVLKNEVLESNDETYKLSDFQSLFGQDTEGGFAALKAYYDQLYQEYVAQRANFKKRLDQVSTIEGKMFLFDQDAAEGKAILDAQKQVQNFKELLDSIGEDDGWVTSVESKTEAIRQFFIELGPQSQELSSDSALQLLEKFQEELELKKQIIPIVAKQMDNLWKVLFKGPSGLEILSAEELEKMVEATDKLSSFVDQLEFENTLILKNEEARAQAIASRKIEQIAIEGGITDYQKFATAVKEAIKTQFELKKELADSDAKIAAKSKDRQQGMEDYADTLSSFTAFGIKVYKNFTNSVNEFSEAQVKNLQKGEELLEFYKTELSLVDATNAERKKAIALKQYDALIEKDATGSLASKREELADTLDLIAKDEVRKRGMEDYRNTLESVTAFGIKVYGNFTEAVEKFGEAQLDNAEKGIGMLEFYKTELSLVGKTNAEREKAIALKQYDLLIEQDATGLLASKREELVATLDLIANNEAIDAFSNKLADAIVDPFEAAIFSGARLIDTLEQVYLAVIKLTLQEAAINPFKQFLSAGISAMIGGGPKVDPNFVGPPAPTVQNSLGNVYKDSHFVPFSLGGVFSGPTKMGVNGGQSTGLFGEGGLEAAVPLTRTKGGQLGVRVEGQSFGNTYNFNYNFNNTDEKGFRKTQNQLLSDAKRIMK